MSKKEKNDKKAIEQSYINSYSYTSSQRVGGCVIAFIILCGIILFGVVLVIGLIDIFVP